MSVGVKIRVNAALGRANRAEVKSNMRTINIVEVVRIEPMIVSSHEIGKSTRPMIDVHEASVPCYHPLILLQMQNSK